MMQDAIQSFPQQFSFEPKIINAEKLEKKSKIIVCGMGGSHLAADILKDVDPRVRLHVHSSYGLPAWEDAELEKALVIASSYSGNTEEVIDAYEQAQAKGLALAVIAVGGSLIEKAKADGVPYIQMPDTGIQPRSALGYSFVALSAMLGLGDVQKQAHQLAEHLDPQALEQTGKDLAAKLQGKVPIIYTAQEKYSVAYNWKIKFNETGKIPAFYNVLPELNHNEMTGFDVAEASKHLSDNFHFIFIHDANDHKRVQKRMGIMEKLYIDRGLPVTRLEMQGNDILEKICNSLILADWTAVYTAEQYGLESEQVPMVEEFKDLMKE